MNRWEFWKSAAACALVLPALWLVGRVTQWCFRNLPISRVEYLGGEGFWLLVIVGSMIASSMAVGLASAWFARAVGHATIRTLLAPSRAHLFGLLTALMLWLALTGVYWENYRQDDLLTAVWYILLGAANGMFGVAWFVLAARASSSLRQFRAGVLLLGAAALTLAVAFASYVFLMLLIEQSPPEINLPFFGVLTLLLMGFYVIPPALASAGFAAVWGGLFSLRDGRGKVSPDTGVDEAH